MRFLAAVVRFCCDFIIGDDWKMAVAVVVSLGAAVVLLKAGTAAALLAPATALIVMTAFMIAVVIDVRGG
ncbi:MAG: hypothetical protein ACRDZ4_03065 [Egibacteraceae bacterium]